MTIKIIKVNGEFVIVELSNKKQKVCPLEIFPKGIIVGSLINLKIVKN